MKAAGRPKSTLTAPTYPLAPSPTPPGSASNNTMSILLLYSLYIFSLRLVSFASHRDLVNSSVHAERSDTRQGTGGGPRGPRRAQHELCSCHIMVTCPGFQGEGLGHQATLGSGYFLTYMEACLPSRNATPLKTSPTCGVEEAVPKLRFRKL